jgi:hypothetical protein
MKKKNEPRSRLELKETFSSATLSFSTQEIDFKKLKGSELLRLKRALEAYVEYWGIGK